MRITQRTKTNGYEKVYVAYGSIGGVKVIGKGKTAYRAFTSAVKSYNSKVAL